MVDLGLLPWMVGSPTQEALFLGPLTCWLLCFVFLRKQQLVYFILLKKVIHLLFKL